MTRTIPVFLVLIVTQLILGCGTTTLQLKDGSEIRGNLTSSDATQLQLQSDIGGSPVSVNRSEIEGVDYAGDAAESWGIGLTATGGAAVLLGLTLALNTGDGWAGALIGGVLTVGGAPLVLTGVPLWVAGAVKKSDQRTIYENDEKAAGMFQSPTQPDTYKLTLRF